MAWYHCDVLKKLFINTVHGTTPSCDHDFDDSKARPSWRHGMMRSSDWLNQGKQHWRALLQVSCWRKASIGYYWLILGMYCQHSKIATGLPTSNGTSGSWSIPLPYRVDFADSKMDWWKHSVSKGNSSHENGARKTTIPKNKILEHQGFYTGTGTIHLFNPFFMSLWVWLSQFWFCLSFKIAR